MQIFYDLIYFLFCLVYFPYLLVNQKWHPHFFMRMGFFPKDIGKRFRQRQNIWVHAVSVGEVLAVKKLIERIKTSYPQHHIVISTVTQTGYVIAQSNFTRAETVIYAPLDFTFIVRKFIKTINPKLYMTAETEIWPNLLTALHQHKIPIVQVNGRISDKSFGGYQAVRFLTQGVLKSVTIFCMQTSRDAQRIIALGAPKDSVRVVGNLKFDDMPLTEEFQLDNLSFLDLFITNIKSFQKEKVEILTTAINVSTEKVSKADEKIWIAGSTHPGEENIILDIYKNLLLEFKELRLIIAPRHPERTAEVLKLVEDKAMAPVKFSELRKGRTPHNGVIVVDTMGDLKALYSLAYIVFVGKSLTVGGGHNIIEPAAFAKPIVIGPKTDNFKDIVQIFLENQAVVQVKDREELLLSMRELLKSPQRVNQLGRKAKEVVAMNHGAVEKTMAIINQFLK